ncbi:MAG: 2-keto-4-pentenoate hydratase/2-oxohepta-3-ene-1,7-dioic acid hydratase in catechol pathway [Paracoccaceae bacterium]|jgi:2-keto-4-pentenoate hydratase/2-oxohepta-3-ene-1,7-dioic acid hydratase in catechol pathway
MKLVRFGALGKEKPGALHSDGSLRDLSAHVADIGSEAISATGLTALEQINLSRCPIVDPKIRLGACVAGTGKFVCVGLNYSDHAVETGMAVPVEPILFMKATSAMCGPNDPILIPRGSMKTDWEVELAIIIGAKAKYVTKENALDYIAGYALANDVSERAFQIEGTGQWTKGKSYDNFGQLGPWLVTKEEVKNTHDLNMWLSVNGQIRQKGSTRTMIFGVEYLVSYISQFMTLHPGDVISTGTPPGVGMGQKPPTYLKAGDVVELSIEGLGQQRQDVVQDA